MAERPSDQGDGADEQEPATKRHEGGKRSVGLTQVDTAQWEPAERPQAS